jgi:arylsulfatase A-like enzyme
VSGEGGIPFYQKYDDNTNYDVYVSRYDAEINMVDQGFRTIVEALERRGFLDRTIVVFTADHGEGMGEHEYYFAHGEYLYEGLIHVPLILRYGKRLQGRREDVVRHIDIVPTLLEMAGVKAPSSLRGSDLRREDHADREVLAEMDSPLPGNGSRVSLTRGGLKLVHTRWDGGFRLYDLRSDPREEVDLYGDPAYQREAEDLRGAMDRLLTEDRLRLPRPAAPRAPSAEEAERLRSLGYVR